MADKGWIKLYRQLDDCYLWHDKPFNQGAAWVDILLMANHRDAKIMFDKKPLEVKAGCFITSSLKLSERWGWSRGKVSRFLTTLQDEGMIEVDVDRKRTSISVVNYSKFQGWQTTDSTTDEQLTDNRRATDGQLTDINNNEKNKKNVKNEKKIRETYFPGDEILNQSFTDFVQMRKSIKKPLATDRAIDLAIKKLMELSGGDNDLAIQIINQSVMNSWQSFYPLKEQKQKSNEIDWSKI